MRKRVLFLLVAYGLMAATVLVKAAFSANAVPFGSHSFAYSNLVITPTSQTRAQMDTVVQNFYTSWKAAYVVSGCAANRRRINYDGGNQTVSEAHGYGMLAAVLMAGYDSDAQAMFDDFYRYFRAHNATGAGGSDLMAWQQDASCANINGSDSASDGDLDIAMALLMADRQWGSCGSIDYKAEGLKVIAAIKTGETDTTHAYIKLGNWAIPSDATYYPSTRSSDFLLSHYRSYKWATGDTAWDTVLNTTYNIISSLQTNYSPTTGLLPDFIKDPLSSPAPVVGYFLEDATTDGNWGYNACRDPWRITTDLAASGDVRAQAAMQKIKAFIKTSSGGSATNLNAERYLNGTVIGNYEEMSFSAPYMVNAMSDPSDQAWMNLLWNRVSTRPLAGYFGDSIKLISMIVVTGNWWQPEAYGDPCAVGTPTFTSTRTSTPSRTPTPTDTRTRTATASPSSTPSFSATATISAATSATSSATQTRTRTATSSASTTPSGTMTFSSTVSSTNSNTPAGTLTDTPTVTTSASSTASPTSSETPAGTLTDSPTLSVTLNASASSTGTPSFTVTVNASDTSSASPTATRSATATRTASATLPSATATPTPSATNVPINGNCRNVLAYYTSWSKPAYSAADIPYNKLTHICHAFLLPAADGSLPVPGGFLEAGLIPQAHATGVKVLVSVGGATGSANFSAIVASPAAQANFVAQVKAFLLANSYDGVDLDWEFPTAGEKTAFTGLVQALRTSFNTAPNAHPEWLISGAYSWTPYFANNYDLPALTPLIDFFNVMTYDAHGSWSAHSGHNAPLGAAAGDPDAVSMQTAINYFTSRGVPTSKINYGLAFYGYDFPTETLHASCPTCGTDVQTRSYSEIATYVGNGWTRVWDASASSPYLTNDTDARVISYDDPQSILAKSDYALNARGLAGVFMWDLSLDKLGNGSQPLLDAMRTAMNCGPTYTPTNTPTPITFSIPGRIEAEDYVASYDTTAGNAGGVHRSDDVDVEATSDSGGGYDVGWSAPGEWLDFNIDVVTGGSYDVTLRIASNQAGPLTLRLKVDGAVLGGPISLPNTGGWQAWADVAVPGQGFSAGPHTLRLEFITGGMNVNYIDIKTPPTPTCTMTPSQTPVPPGSTMTNTPSPTPAPPTATNSPTPGEGPLVALHCVPGPNPNPSSMLVEMQGPADEVELRFYDRAMRCVLSFKKLNLYRGWNHVDLPAEFRSLSNGTYFFRLSCRRESVTARPLMGRLVVLR